MDCSGFVSTAFKSIEIPLSRSSQEMATQGKKIKLSNVQVGDLLFFKTLRKNRISHVGLVVDVDGGEVKFIHASSKRGVVISSLSDAYYKKAFRIAKRVM
jgi:NLP/P60 protein